MNNITDTLQQIYNKKGYLDHYGGSVFITFMTVLIFFVIISYFQVMNNLRPIKADWVTQRCNPLVIPFAGLINKEPGTSTLDFTAQNFTYCINNILVSIAQDAFKPIAYLMSVIKDSGKDLSMAVNAVRKKIADMLNQISSIVTEIMGRILNFLIPLQQMMIKMKDILKKSQAALVASLYSVISGYLGLNSFVKVFIDILIKFLLMLTAIIVPLLLFFFTAPMAIAPLFVYGIVAGFVILVTVGLSDVLHMTQSSVPPKPRCFDEDTIIMKKHNVPCKIKNIKLGDILVNNEIVTATFKLSSCEMDMYRYKGVVVSGNHYILDKDDVWVHIKDLPKANKIYDYRKENIYCINTTSKSICINQCIFTDWDSLDEMDIIDIRRICKNYLPSQFNRSQFHRYLDGGFIGNTSIELDNGQSVDIQDVEVNDVLRFGERILGKVEICAKDFQVKSYTIQEHDFLCGPNNCIIDDDVEFGSTLDLSGKYISEQPIKLYHLITDTNYIVINGIKFSDYNGCLEKFLNQEQHKLKLL